MMNTALWCVAVLGIMLFGLGIFISAGRYFTSDFHVGNADRTRFTTKLSRAHGNTAEFAPFLAVLMLYLGTKATADCVQLAMVAATVCRVLVVGFLTSATLSKMSVIKAVGVMGTYAFALALSGALLLPV